MAQNANGGVALREIAAIDDLIGPNLTNAIG
jgi:hypothetical protein